MYNERYKYGTLILEETLFLENKIKVKLKQKLE